MKCPHCIEGIHQAWAAVATFSDPDGDWIVHIMTCPECERVIVRLKNQTTDRMELIRPRAVARAPLPLDVPGEFAADYREACAVLADSPKASAALSRRCLQRLLRDKGGVKPGNLFNEIGQAMKTLPSYLAGSVDAVRNIGVFAAHPLKSTNTGEIVEVEPGEAEWLLDTLEGLFDFYFVQPENNRRKREALNEKLKEAGKPPMKTPSTGEDADGAA